MKHLTDSKAVNQELNAIQSEDYFNFPTYLSKANNPNKKKRFYKLFLISIIGLIISTAIYLGA